MTTPDATLPPRVFVSYSHDSRDHMERVLALADRLTADGLDVRLDRYAGVPKEGWSLWMERQVRDAELVLVVWTETYRRRFDREEPRGTGRGVKWEGAILRRALYRAEGDNDRFVPVLLPGSDPCAIPDPLQDTTPYLLGPDGSGYEDLYWRLTDQHRSESPERGRLRQREPRLVTCSRFRSQDPVPRRAESVDAGSRDVLVREEQHQPISRRAGWSVSSPSVSAA